MVASCSAGAEGVLAKELNKLDAQAVRLANRAVLFEGDQEMMYKANLCLRTATRILVPIKKFKAHNPQVLYERVKKMNWGRFIRLENTFKVEGTINSELFTHSQFAMLKVKDAVADWFMQRKGKRPSVDKDNPDFVIHVRIFENEVQISLDSSGDPLFKRGYRGVEADAPIKEDLAAALLLNAKYDGSKNFYDPFCGSGTLLIEAALIAGNRAPNLNRGFCFMNWADFNEELLEKVKQDAVDREKPITVEIIGGDVSLRACKVAEKTVEIAGLADKIQILNEPFEDFLKVPRTGMMVSNPPYGERVQALDLDVLYRHLGNSLKQQPDLEAYIITSNKQALRKMKVKRKVKKSIFNGRLECVFVEISTGS